MADHPPADRHQAVVVVVVAAVVGMAALAVAPVAPAVPEEWAAATAPATSTL